MESEEIEMPAMHWRHKENGWEVVSTVLCEKWDNATHPSEHNEFVENKVGGDVTGEGVQRFAPKDSREWETFMTNETQKPMVFDQTAYFQFEKTFATEVDIFDVDNIVEFLNNTFTSEHKFSNPRTKTDNQGNTVMKTSFSRTFPVRKNAILSEEPTQKEKQVLQFTLNKMRSVADNQETGTPVRQVLRLFDLLENADSETLVSHAVKYIEPSLNTKKKPVKTGAGHIKTDDSGRPVMTEVVDPEARENTREKLMTVLTDQKQKQTARTTKAESPTNSGTGSNDRFVKPSQSA